MRYALQILSKVAERLGLGQDEAMKYADILEDNWYDSESSFRGLQSDELKLMNIPDRVGQEIIDLVHQPCLDERIAEEKITEDKHDAREIQVDDPVHQYINIFSTEAVSNEDKIETLELLLKIIGNILEHPENDKYRRLNSQSDKLVKTLFQYPSMCQLLQFLRFESTPDQLLILYPQNTIFPLLDNSRKIIAECLSKLRLEKPVGRYAFATDTQTPAELKTQHENDERLKQEILEQCRNELSLLTFQFDELNKVYKIDSKIRVFKPSDSKSKQEVPQANSSPVNSKEVAEFVQKLNQFQEQYLDLILSNEEIKSSFYKISSAYLSGTAIIRVKMPNGYTIELQLAADKTISQLFDVVRTQLIHATEPFHLRMLGFSKNRYDQSGPLAQKRLRDLDMYPDARLELVYDSLHMKRFDKLLKCEL
jgi:hypothetical protein